jgi:hypothetical protein
MINSLQDEIMHKLASDIQKDIDALVLFEMYKDLGWYPVEDCKNLSFNKPALDQVEQWLTNICAGKFHIKSHTDYIFELQGDAMMFKLKWA